MPDTELHTHADSWTARLDVAAAVHTYLAAIDDKRYSDAGACFTDDGALVFGEREIRSPSAIATEIESGLGRYETTQHLVSNEMVTLSHGPDGGDTAHFRGEVIGTHLWTDDAPRLSVVGGRYNVELRKESDEWYVVRFAPTYLWTLGDELAH